MTAPVPDEHRDAHLINLRLALGSIVAPVRIFPFLCPSLPPANTWGTHLVSFLRPHASHVVVAPSFRSPVARLLSTIPSVHVAPPPFPAFLSRPSPDTHTDPDPAETPRLRTLPLRLRHLRHRHARPPLPPASPPRPPRPVPTLVLVLPILVRPREPRARSRPAPCPRPRRLAARRDRPRPRDVPRAAHNQGGRLREDARRPRRHAAEQERVRRARARELGVRSSCTSVASGSDAIVEESRGSHAYIHRLRRLGDRRTAAWRVYSVAYTVSRR
ncbi:uncharacterized protein B0H18DRAFT_95175 [Fomitopsis serialis]|uniref:uncharacterized protein n=1 Tax=Fomitopsis serialis TaxID=139415 RepID=UPI002008DD9A|nr:uncharacterized protein B0H18DRAFT_95175 [Neoantrodia serialis]KAH9915537.1 hypothetical protein B0H18DRAFT_95175 [Neoantrodia serialis]